MMLFGLGTLPNLMAMGLAAASLDRFRTQPAIRRVAGAILILYALMEVGLWLSHQMMQ